MRYILLERKTERQRGCLHTHTWPMLERETERYREDISERDRENVSVLHGLPQILWCATKEPYISAKEAYISAKETLYLHQGALDLLNAKDSLKIPEKCVRQTHRETWY